MIEQMRADFADAAQWEEWSAAEQEEIGAEIRTAIAGNDVEALAYWAGYLANAAASWRAWRQRVRDVEARIKQGRAD